MLYVLIRPWWFSNIKKSNADFYIFLLLLGLQLLIWIVEYNCFTQNTKPYSLTTFVSSCKKMDVDLRFDVIVSQTIGEGVEDEISSFFSLLLKSNAMGPFISRSTCSLTVICETLHLHQCCYHQCCYQWFTIASGSWHSFVSLK